MRCALDIAFDLGAPALGIPNVDVSHRSCHTALRVESDASHLSQSFLFGDACPAVRVLVLSAERQVLFVDMATSSFVSFLRVYLRLVRLRCIVCSGLQLRLYQFLHDELRVVNCLMIIIV